MNEEEEIRMSKCTERKMNPNGVPVSELNKEAWLTNISTLSLSPKTRRQVFCIRLPKAEGQFQSSVCRCAVHLPTANGGIVQ